MSHSDKTVILDRDPHEETDVGSGFATTEHTLNGRFRMLRQLGAGGIDVTGAVDRRRIQTLQNEFLVLGLLRHPGVARVCDFGRDLKSGGLFFTIELPDPSERDVVGLARHFIKAEKLRDALNYGSQAADKFVREFRLHSALEVLLQVAELARKLGSSIPTQHCYELAKLFRLCGKFENARQILLNVHDELQMSDVADLLAQTCIDLAQIDGSLDEARGLFKRAERMAEKAPCSCAARPSTTRARIPR